MDRIESLVVDEAKLNTASFYTRIYPANRDAVKLRLDKMAESKSPELQQAAIIAAYLLRTQSPEFKSEFQIGEEWLLPLLTFSSDKNATCNGEAVALSIELFPNQPV